MLVESKCFAGKAFKPISEDGFASRFTDGDSETRCSRGIDAGKKTKRSPPGRDFGRQNLLKVFVGANTLGFFVKQSFQKDLSNQGIILKGDSKKCF